MIDLIQVAGVRGGCPAVTHDLTLMTGPAAPDTKTPPARTVPERGVS